MGNAKPHAAGITPHPELIGLARARVDATSVERTARELGVSRSSLCAMLAGLRVRRGTVLLLAQALRWQGPGPVSPSNATPPKSVA